MKRSRIKRQSTRPTRQLELTADRLWALLILARAGNRCQICHKPRCQAAHIIPRRYKHFRHDPRNGLALCPVCHSFVDSHKPLFKEWLTMNNPAAVVLVQGKWVAKGPATAAMLAEKIEELKSELRKFV